ncbi:unnamed protein product [Adineta ricciae]|uniref:Uncharacterized protein n=1 Tax=Adineta ricciae TaxID=249248 RepID=A0A813UU68_ADIRI|nr:unnamed protein product [Adineta ricciae]
MTSSNKVRRYLQHHKQQYLESQNNHQSAADLLAMDSTLNSTNTRRFRGRTQQPLSSSTTATTTVATTTAPVSIPQICVDNDDDYIDNTKPSDDNDDDDGHVAILDEFDQVLENELKRNSLLRTSSLKQKEFYSSAEIPMNQQRSFSFALGSPTNSDDKQTDEGIHSGELVHTSPLLSKSTKLPATIKASLSKETFSRLLHSLAFRSGTHSSTRIAMSTTDASTQQSLSPCLACRNHSNLDLLPKCRKRPSIFGVLVSKLNTTTTTVNENNPNRCSLCKRRLSKSIFYSTITNHIDDDKQLLSPSTQNFSSTSLTSSKLLHDHGHLLLRTKRRRSLPSLFHTLFDFDHQDKQHVNNKHIQHRPSFSSVLTHTLSDTVTNDQQQRQPQSIAIIKQTSTNSCSSISLSESDEDETNRNLKSYQRQSITFDDSSQLTEKIRTDSGANEDENKMVFDKEFSSNGMNNMSTDESTTEFNPNQLFVHPPEEKTRSLLVNVFRTRRSNITLGSNETNMVGKQFSVSVINLTTSNGTNQNHSTSSMNNNSPLVNHHIDLRKHALSEENLPTITDGTYIYFTDINGQSFRERLRWSGVVESTTLREILVQLFEKYQLNIEKCNICLRSAPTLPLSLDQPVKHLLLDDLVVTGITKNFAD